MIGLAIAEVLTVVNIYGINLDIITYVLKFYKILETYFS
jgi:hypothetical protein